MPGPSLEKRRIQVSSGPASSAKLRSLASTHPFVQQETLEDALSHLETRYGKGKMRVADLLGWAAEGKLGDLLVLTPTPDTSSDVWCLDTRGLLTLSVCKETYEDLGIAGKALPFKGRSDRHAIQIALGPNADSGEPTPTTKASLAKQKALFEFWEGRRKVRNGLDGWDVVWCPNSITVNGDTNPDSEIPGLSAQERREARPTKRQLRDVHIPANSAIFAPRPTAEHGRGLGSKGSKAELEEALEDWNEGAFEVLEWAGMAILGAQRLQANDQVNPFVAVYEPPSASRVGDVTHMSWRGLLAPRFVQSIIDTVCSTLAAQRIEDSFAAITLHGIPTTPVGYLPTAGGSIPARLPREDGEDTVNLLIGSPSPSGPEEFECVTIESIGQWDARWG